MCMTQAERIAPQKTSEAICWKKKGSRVTLRAGDQFPVWVGGGVPNPLAELIHAYRIWAVSVIGSDPCRDHGNNNNGKDEKTFRHSAGLYRSGWMRICFKTVTFTNIVFMRLPCFFSIEHYN